MKPITYEFRTPGDARGFYDSLTNLDATIKGLRVVVSERPTSAPNWFWQSASLAKRFGGREVPS